MLVQKGFRLAAGPPAPAVVGLTLTGKRKLSYLPTKGSGGRNSFNGVSATVFGSTGFLGRYVVNRLCRQGTQLTIPHRGDPHDYRHIRVMGELGQINFLDFHLKDQESVAKTVQHSNVVVNMIGKEFETRNFTFEEALIDGPRSIAKAAKEAGVKRFIHVSALNADPDSPSKFMRCKALGENAVFEEFPDATILRPGTMFGREDKFLNNYAYLRHLPMGMPLIDGGMNTTKMPVYVVDVALAVLHAIKDESSIGKTYEIVGPKEFYLYDIIDYVFRVLRLNYRPYTMPTKLYQFIAYLFELSIFSPRLTRDMLCRQFLSDKLTPGLPGLEDLGVQPTPLESEAITVLRRHRRPLTYEDVVEEDEICKPTSTYA